MVEGREGRWSQWWAVSIMTSLKTSAAVQIRMQLGRIGLSLCLILCVCACVCVCVCVCVRVRVDMWVMTRHVFTQIHTNPTTQPNQPASGHVLIGMVFWAANAHTIHNRDVGGGGSKVLVGILVVQEWDK